MIEMKEFRVDEIFDILSTKSVFNACDVTVLDSQIEGSHPYVVRTAYNNGIKGYLREDESKLNPGNTISFAQDTAQIFYQSKPYFTGNNIKIFSLKNHILTESLALYLITCLNKAFSTFSWGQSFKYEILQRVELSLPFKRIKLPDWKTLSYLSFDEGGAV